MQGHASDDPYQVCLYDNMAEREAGVEERYQCPICCEVFQTPVYIRTCTHTFCKQCLQQLPPSGGALSCPVCRTTFNSSDIRRHTSLEQDMAKTFLTCPTCHMKCKLVHWRVHSNTHPQAAVSIPPPCFTHHKVKGPAPPPNRSTFNCPLCPQQHLSTSDLLTHVNTLHTNSQAAVVCPVCASMPWGVKDQTSQNFVQHLNLRHKFEYETFVDYGEDEEAVLQATLKASLAEQ